MGAILNRLVSDYYESHRAAGDANSDALGAMKGIEQHVVDEVLREHVDELQILEARKREERLVREREKVLKESTKSFVRLLLEAVFLGLVVGLIGSHLYGLVEARLYSPNPDFDYPSSFAVLALLLVACIALLLYVFFASVPDWVANAVRWDSDERKAG